MAARRKGERAEVPVTREAIVDAAFRMIEERGGQDFSMRALATEMGVFPATLYWHVGDRAKLLGLVGARWIGEVASPDEITDWREWLRESARRYRANAHAHPHVARLVSTERTRDASGLTLPDALVGTLAELGFKDDLVHA